MLLLLLLLILLLLIKLLLVYNLITRTRLLQQCILAFMRLAADLSIFEDSFLLGIHLAFSNSYYNNATFNVNKNPNPINC